MKQWIISVAVNVIVATAIVGVVKQCVVMIASLPSSRSFRHSREGGNLKIFYLDSRLRGNDGEVVGMTGNWRERLWKTV